MAEENENEGGVEEVEEEEICEEGAPGWVVTFGDMMSLLLTFFILLLSFATMDILRYIELAGTIKQGFGLPVKERVVVVPKAEHIIRLKPKVDFNSRRVLEELRRKLDPNAPTKRTAKVTIEVFQSYRGVVVLFLQMKCCWGSDLKTHSQTPVEDCCGQSTAREEFRPFSRDQA